MENMKCVVKLCVTVLIGCAIALPARGAELLFGALVPLTGAWSSSGIASKAALEIAVEDINKELADRGLPFQIRVIFQNTETDPAIALQKLQALAAQGVRLVVGPQSSAEVRAVKEFADSHGILLISQSSTAGSLAIAGDNVFRFTQDDSFEGPAAAHLMKEDGIRAVVPMWRADAGNDGLASSTRLAFEGLGGLVTPGVRYGTSVVDFTAELRALRAQVDEAIARTDRRAVAVYLAAFGEVTSLFQQAQKDPALSAVRWYGSDGNAQNPEIANNPEAALFAVRSGYPNPIPGLVDEARDKWEPVLQRIRDKIGYDPDTYCLAAYDALWVAMLATNAAGPGADVAALKSALVMTADSYFGTTGSTALNEAGDRKYGSQEFWGVQEEHGIFLWASQSQFVFEPGQAGRLVRNPSPRFFPVLQTQGSDYTGIAVSNASGRKALLRLGAFGSSGRALAPSLPPFFADLEPGQAMARLGSEMFGPPQAALQFGWVRMSSDVPELGTMIQHGGTAHLSGSIAYALPAKRLYFTRALEGPAAFRGQSTSTFLSIVNPGEQAAVLKLRLVAGTGAAFSEQSRTLPPGGSLFESVTSLFGKRLPPAAAYVTVAVVEGDGVVGSEVIRWNTHKPLLELNASYGNAFNTAFSGMVILTGDLSSNLKLVNAAGSTRSLRLALSDQEGVAAAPPVRLSLAAGASLEKEVDQIFTLFPAQSFVGSLRVEADGPGVIGDVILSNTDDFYWGMASPLQTRPALRAVFSHVAEGRSWITRLVLFNPGNATAVVNISVVNSRGEKVGEHSLRLFAGRTEEADVSDLVPAAARLLGGTIEVTSSVPLVLHERFIDFSALGVDTVVPPTVLR